MPAALLSMLSTGLQKLLWNIKEFKIWIFIYVHVKSWWSYKLFFLVVCSSKIFLYWTFNCVDAVLFYILTLYKLPLYTCIHVSFTIPHPLFEVAAKESTLWWEQKADLKRKFDLFPRDCMLWALTFLPLPLTRQIAVTVVDQEKAEQGLGRMTGFRLQSALPRLFSFLLRQWNPSAASHKNCKKANSRWR